jgi:hypothetical protein
LSTVPDSLKEAVSVISMRWAAAALFLLVVLALPADAYQAKWGASRLKIIYELNVEKTGKFKFKGSEFSDEITLDSTFGDRIRLDIGSFVDHPMLDVEVEGANDKKANVVVVSDEDAAEFVGRVWQYLDSGNGGKMLKLPYTPVTFATTEAKGKLNVTGQFTKCSFKLTVKFTGTVQSGEYTGTPVKGKLKILFKGDRM